jgi:hypothetical protein
MELFECKHGLLVITEDKRVGITNNVPSSDISIRSKVENAVPLVQFSGNLTPIGIHHGNLKLFE